ncbi:MAG: TRAP transporter small permease subunit [Phycisphaerales bacterium]|jgi:TRAP-type mannitol/chloroaromatic compound transport system permease small subunit
MRKVLSIIDIVSENAGKIARWFGALLILVVVYDVVARYVFNAPTMWGYEVGIALGMSLYCFGYAYTESKHGHVRVDVFYIHLSQRGKAIVDTVGGFIFFLPTIALVVFAAWNKMWWSWDVMEKSVEGYWYPPWYPLRTMIFLGFTLLLVQGLANLYRSVYRLAKGREYDA